MVATLRITPVHDQPPEGVAANRYTILRRLAGGGMADIFLARATHEAGIGRTVVLKRVLATHARDASYATMFLDEARLVAQLQHPNIAQVYDIGTINGAYFFTMEYVHGENVLTILQRLVSQRSRLPLEHVMYIARDTAAALHHAHDRVGQDGRPLGVIHRDVSPSNVMVSYEGVVKLLDFGVAKATASSGETQTGTIKGKVGYLSPEQCSGDPIDRRTDIFLLGIVMYEMLTGRRLYKRETDLATMNAIVYESVPPPSRIRPDIPPGLDRIVMAALEKDPRRRFVTAADVVDELEAIAAHHQLVLSASSTSRFMRTLFGARPEPWADTPTEPQEPASSSIASEVVTTIETSPVVQEAMLTELVEQLAAAEPMWPRASHAELPATPPTAPRIPAPMPATVSVRPSRLLIPSRRLVFAALSILAITAVLAELIAVLRHVRVSASASAAVYRAIDPPSITPQLVASELPPPHTAPEPQAEPQAPPPAPNKPSRTPVKRVDQCEVHPLRCQK